MHSESEEAYIMDQVQISVELNQAADESWKQRCYDRVKRLKELELLNNNGAKPSHQPQPRLLEDQLFLVKNSAIIELQTAVQNGNVYSFVDVLEQLCRETKLHLSAIFDQVTYNGDSLLHHAALYGKINIAELIVHHFPELLTRKNNKGDTPLHLAVKTETERLNIINLFLSKNDAHNHAQESTSSPPVDDDQKLTRLVNESGDTALHVAVSCNYDEGVTLLFEADQCVAHYLNKAGHSPWFLAVAFNSKPLLYNLLEAPFPEDESFPKCHGNSPLHAAIFCSKASIIEEIAEKKPDLMYLRDEAGGTPLHYAAASGYVEAVRILLSKSPLSAFEWNAKGHLPLHLACKMGHVNVVKEFFKKEWGCNSSILDNKKGQNIFHIAAKNGQYNMVTYLLRNTELKRMSNILNNGDKNGDTPLHLASKNLFPKIIFSLAKDKRVLKNLYNHEGLLARDLVYSQSEMPMTFRQNLSELVLKHFGGRTTEKGTNMYVKPKLRVPPGVDQVKDKVNTLMLVAILIATVTFAAGFTVPGGVYSSDDKTEKNRGMALLGNKGMFKLYVVFNSLAMYFSTFGTFLLLWAQLSDYYLTKRIFKCALVVVGLALAFMTLSFMGGVPAVLTNEPSFAKFVYATGGILYLLILYMSFLCFPLLTFDYYSYRFSGETFRSTIWFAILFSGNYPKMMKNKKPQGCA